MKLFKLLAPLFLLCSLQNSFALDHTDGEKITNIIYGYVDAWNHHSGRGFAENFSLDGDFINIFGMHFHGKKAIQDRHNEIHDTFLKDSTLHISSLELREINPHLVLAFVRWQVDGFHKPHAEQSEPGETIRGIFSHVFVKNNDLWEITATQNTLGSN